MPRHWADHLLSPGFSFPVCRVKAETWWRCTEFAWFPPEVSEHTNRRLRELWLGHWCVLWLRSGWQRAPAWSSLLYGLRGGLQMTSLKFKCVKCQAWQDKKRCCRWQINRSQEAQQSTSINLFPSVHIHLTTLSLFRDNYPWQQTTVVPPRRLSFFIKRHNENSKPKDTTV